MLTFSLAGLFDPSKPVRVPFERSAAERERRRAANVVEALTRPMRRL